MNTLRASWTVPLDHPAFPGHFPGNPIVPGVVLLDQVLRLLEAQENAQGRGRVQGWTLSQAKFLSPVGPGETLTFELTPDSRAGWHFVVRAAADRQVAAGSATARFP